MGDKSVVFETIARVDLLEGHSKEIGPGDCGINEQNRGQLGSSWV